MNKFTNHTGKTVALYQANIDTDQIIPKQFLKRIERTGYGAFLFYDWRFNREGTARQDFVLNDSRYKDASILLTGANFGCGSSREHAAWSLMDYGFRVIIAPSFADIFYNNSLKNGLLPVVLPEDKISLLARKSEALENYCLTVDLKNRTVTDDEGFEVGFEIDEFRRRCLINGLDDIGLTLKQEAEISRYENSRKILTSFSPF
jgi:3-isopropylmalate/(R)-2-methylmalate dehydratase small subunit